MMKIIAFSAFVFAALGIFGTVKGWGTRSKKENNRLIGVSVFFVICGFILWAASTDEGKGVVVSAGSETAQTTSQQVKQNQLNTEVKEQPKADPNSPKRNPDLKIVAASGGLGDSYEQIVKLFGQPTRTNQAMEGGVGWFGFQNDLQLIRFSEGRVQHIDYQLDTKKMSMPMTQAKEFIKKVMPADATPVKEYDKDVNEHVMVFKSKTLAGLFSETKFENADGDINPGEFDVILMHMGNQVDAISAFLSDNP